MSKAHSYANEGKRQGTYLPLGGRRERDTGPWCRSRDSNPCHRMRNPTLYPAELHRHELVLKGRETFLPVEGNHRNRFLFCGIIQLSAKLCKVKTVPVCKSACLLALSGHVFALKVVLGANAGECGGVCCAQLFSESYLCSLLQIPDRDVDIAGAASGYRCAQHLFDPASMHSLSFGADEESVGSIYRRFTNGKVVVDRFFS